MKRELSAAALLLYVSLSLFLSAQPGAMAAPAVSPTAWASPTAKPSPTPLAVKTPSVATPEQLLAATLQWQLTRHSRTFDNGLGANSTCALCKAPRNYNSNPVALEASHDCAACKREPGLPRPDLDAGVPVPQPDWQSISCDTCHQAVGNSYSTAIAYWDPLLQEYQPVARSADLCAKCHAEQHGFGVIEQQAHSPAHHDWDCSRCHGGHNLPVRCTDCHDTRQGAAVVEHATHPAVDCTACHDAGALEIWEDPIKSSRYYQVWMPQQMAHDLRSWPSHNLQTQVDCRRCHHPQVPGATEQALANAAGCVNALCHSQGLPLDRICPTAPWCMSRACHSITDPERTWTRQ